MREGAAGVFQSCCLWEHWVSDSCCSSFVSCKQRAQSAARGCCTWSSITSMTSGKRGLRSSFAALGRWACVGTGVKSSLRQVGTCWDCCQGGWASVPPQPLCLPGLSPAPTPTSWDELCPHLLCSKWRQWLGSVQDGDFQCCEVGILLLGRQKPLMVLFLEIKKRPCPKASHVMICQVVQHDLCLAVGLLFSIDSEGDEASVKAHQKPPGGMWKLEAFLTEILLPLWWCPAAQPVSKHHLAVLPFLLSALPVSVHPARMYLMLQGGIELRGFGGFLGDPLAPSTLLPADSSHVIPCPLSEHKWFLLPSVRVNCAHSIMPVFIL